jgi:hypothetical protein
LIDDLVTILLTCTKLTQVSTVDVNPSTLITNQYHFKRPRTLRRRTLSLFLSRVLLRL